LLKAVDGALLYEWIEWSRLQSDADLGSFGVGNEAGSSSLTTVKSTTCSIFEWARPLGVPASAASAVALWCALAPRGCDISRQPSCGGTSALRAALLKVLTSRSHLVDSLKRLRQRRIVGIKAGKEGNSLVAVADFRRCCRDGGLMLTVDEARLLVDCVDAYRGAGAAPLDELVVLLDRSRRPGDVVRVLRDLTHFEVTCPETGLPNAYRVAANPTRAAPGPQETDITLQNGEVRRRWANPERLRRVELLCRFGLVSVSLDPRNVQDLCPLPRELQSLLPHHLEAELGPDNGSIAAPTLARAPINIDVYRPWFSTESSSIPATSQVRTFGIWGAPRRTALDALLDLSDEARREARLRTVLAAGAVPGMPDLWSATPEELHVEGAQLETLLTRLVLRWRPASADTNGTIAFFSLEFSGSLGSRAQRDNRFAEIARDPPTACDDAFAFQHVVSGLTPDTTYLFRLRAFNSHGPGPYVWRHLTTPPARPRIPLPVRVGARTVMLRWAVPDTLATRAIDLRRAFEECAKNDASCGAIVQRFRKLTTGHGGTEEKKVIVQRAEWLRVLNERYQSTVDFLRRTRASSATITYLSGGVEKGRSNICLLDLFETADVNVIDWAWILDRLAAATDSDGDRTSNRVRRDTIETGEASRLIRNALASDGFSRAGCVKTAEARRVQRLAAPTTHVIERCVNETRGEWEEVLRTRFGEAAVNGLEAGATHQFRVRAVNADGNAAPPGGSIVVNTLLEAPAAPRIVRRVATAGARVASAGLGFDGCFVVSATSVSLTWPRALMCASTDQRASGASGRILAEWVGVGGEDDGAVSLESVLRCFDRKGFFDGALLPNVLTRLGAHRTYSEGPAMCTAVL